jgi:hypothetical protein
MPDQFVSLYNRGIVDQPQSGPLRRVARDTDHRVAIRGAQALVSAATIRGAGYVADEVVTSLDRLRRHEARAAADDPIVADEYAAVRRALLHFGLNELENYGRRLP